MRFIRWFLGSMLVLIVCSFTLRAQGTHQHKHETGEKLGRVNFTVSCNAAAQQQFNRAVALLHSFWYDEAEKAFTDVTKTDPKCGMSYWGVAMSSYHPVWSPPTASELGNGQAAVQKANVVGARTQRERDYIAAIETFYRDADKLDHRTRALAYEKAMEQLYVRYPRDDEAAVFYALALLGTALPAARSYAKIAPSSPHALHMPSHIFSRLGLWQESIESNIASAAAAKAHVAKTNPGAASFDQLHAMDYLAYAYLQTAQDRR